LQFQNENLPRTTQYCKIIVLIQSDQGKTSGNGGNTQKEEPPKIGHANIIVPIAIATSVADISANDAANNGSDGGGRGVGSPDAP